MAEKESRARLAGETSFGLSREDEARFIVRVVRNKMSMRYWNLVSDRNYHLLIFGERLIAVKNFMVNGKNVLALHL